MAFRANGNFRIGGVEHHHPLSSEEIEFLLRVLADMDFKGHMLNNIITITYKLQREYESIKQKEMITKK
jgi:hypothetical protein